MWVKVLFYCLSKIWRLEANLELQDITMKNGFLKSLFADLFLFYILYLLNRKY